jgi:ectoine hydroxylase-related dioxygenase (phytanoyl-CoA dioxygenase family)
MNMQAEIDHLDLFGYCVIEDAIPAQQADRMAETYFALHQDPANRSAFQSPADELYQTLFGLMNLDEQCWGCAAHPKVLAVVRHFLGPNARIGEACSKWVKPGGPAGSVHVDSTQDLPVPLPAEPWMINTMWMTTDFTAENGATLVAPFSHRARRRPAKGMDPADKHMMPVTGRRGSVFLWHGASGMPTAPIARATSIAWG